MDLGNIHGANAESRSCQRSIEIDSKRYLSRQVSRAPQEMLKKQEVEGFEGLAPNSLILGSNQRVISQR